MGKSTKKPIPQKIPVAESKRWWKEAESDLDAAKNSSLAGNYNWSCFQAQQAAEKALKAFLYSNGRTSIITPALKVLVNESIKIDPNFAKIKSEAHFLDLIYISTRYPFGLASDLAPSEFYEQGDAEKCLEYARLILDLVKTCM